MSNFKIGDKVRVRANRGGGIPALTSGTIIVVESSDNSIRIDFDGIGERWVYPEVVEPANDPLDARIAELEAWYAKSQDKTQTYKEDRDQLRDRIANLEETCLEQNRLVHSLSLERNQLRKQVSDITSMWTETCARIKHAEKLIEGFTVELDAERRSHRETEEELEKYKPKLLPMVLKSTHKWNGETP